MNTILDLNPTVTVKLLLTFNPQDKPHDVYMEDKIRSLRTMLIDNFPSLSDTQVRKINRVSDDVCACSIHISNYSVAKVTRYIQKISTDVHGLTMLRTMEFSIIGENR